MNIDEYKYSLYLIDFLKDERVKWKSEELRQEHLNEIDKVDINNTSTNVDYLSELGLKIDKNIMNIEFDGGINRNVFHPNKSVKN